MRRLIYVPIIHAQADMGSLRPALERKFLERYKIGDWHSHTEAIQRFWDNLRKRIESLPLDYKETYIYQDGLPVCGKEVQIVKDLADKASPNHKLVLWLMERGAHLVGTESPALLLAEYELLRQAFSTPKGNRKQVAAPKKRAAQLLAERDDYIRRRIASTLPEGATGILFIGLMHRVGETMPPDIEVLCPFGKPSIEKSRPS